MELLQDPSEEAENRWIIGTKVVIFICGTMLLILCCYNIYNYLVKQHKYKQLTTTLFYIFAISNIVLVMIYSVQVVPVKDYCSWEWLWIIYGTAYANLLVGLCQAGTLTCLVIQLECLFTYSNLLSQPDFQESKQFERQMMKNLKNR